MGALYYAQDIGEDRIKGWVQEGKTTTDVINKELKKDYVRDTAFNAQTGGKFVDLKDKTTQTITVDYFGNAPPPNYQENEEKEYLYAQEQTAKIDKLSSYGYGASMPGFSIIYVDEYGIWVTSSLIDSVLKFDWQWDLQGVLAVPETRLYPRKLRHTVDLNEDYRLRGKVQAGLHNFHANHVTPYDSRYMLVTGRGDLPGGGRVILVNRQNMHYRLWAKGLEGPHDGLFIRLDRFVVTETDTSSVAIVKPSIIWPPTRIERRLFLPSGEKKYWTRGLCLGPEGSLLVGRSVWKGGDGVASVVRISLDGEFISEHALEIENYPECRIFQIVPAPLGVG